MKKESILEVNGVRIKSTKPFPAHIGNAFLPTPSKNQSHEGEKWEKEFDVKFNHFNQQHSSKQICDSECENDYGLEDIKDFIRSLQKDYEAKVVEIVNKLQNLEYHPSNECFDDYCKRCNAREGWEAGYRACLTDLQTELKEKK